MAVKIQESIAFSGGTLTIDRRLEQREGRTYAVQFNYDGALTTSAINVLFSNDGVSYLDYTSEITVVQPPAGGAERTTGINFSYVGYEHMRLELVHSAGSVNIEALLGAVS